MNKDYLVNAFSDVSAHIADNFEDLLLPNLDNNMAMITPHFTDAHIHDIQAWWEWDDHFAKYIMQIEELTNDDPNSRQENLDSGIEEIQENPALWQQLKSMADGSDDGTITVLKHIPHVAQYATCLTRTDGYRALDSLTMRMDNIFIWPMITLDSHSQNLKSAFAANVSIISGDGSALKDKIQKFRRFNA